MILVCRHRGGVDVKRSADYALTIKGMITGMVTGGSACVIHRIIISMKQITISGARSLKRDKNGVNYFRGVTPNIKKRLFCHAYFSKNRLGVT